MESSCVEGTLCEDALSSQPSAAPTIPPAATSPTPPTPHALTVTCHCGKQQGQVWLRLIELEGINEAIMTQCDCPPCRQSIGALFDTYLSIQRPSKFRGLHSRITRSRDFPVASARSFCAICGCHLFKMTMWFERKQNETPTPTMIWWVATAAIVDSPEVSSCDTVGGHLLRPQPLDSTDGGLLRHYISSETDPDAVDDRYPELWMISGDVDDDTHNKAIRQMFSPAPCRAATRPLRGGCVCGQVQFKIDPANGLDLLTDRVPRLPPPRELFDCSWPIDSIFTDVSEAAETFRLLQKKAPWWQTKTRQSHHRYLAYTCMCVDCRLTTGAELQSWAFVPRENIGIRLPDSDWRLLDFNILDMQYRNHNPSPLGVYQSSQTITRHFCSKCGATAFMYDTKNPQLVKVSVGLLAQEDGDALLETHLDWWKGNIGFFEPWAKRYQQKRSGWVIKWANYLGLTLYSKYIVEFLERMSSFGL